MKVALVHDYLNQMGGAERVVLALHEIFPNAPLYTSIYDPERVDPAFAKMDIRTSFMQKLPLVKKHHQPFLPLYPFAMEHLDLRGYDLVLSSSSAFGKGVITRPETMHICYCHTPMRWCWNYYEYVEREQIGKIARGILPFFITGLRIWDTTSAIRVDHFIANSPTVAARIQKYYRRESVVIPPPVEVNRFAVRDNNMSVGTQFIASPNGETSGGVETRLIASSGGGAGDTELQPGTYFLIVSRILPYKRIDLAIKACNALQLPLVIIGSGRYEQELRKIAGPTIYFQGRLSDEEVLQYYTNCRALLLPGEEDFGITPLEAQASGRPVIAFGAGGALASVVDGVTGTFFHEQTVESMIAALSSFDERNYDPYAIRNHALEFDKSRFHRRILQFIEAKLSEGKPKNLRTPTNELVR